MREEWTARKKERPGITTPLIDRLISAARRAGSTGRKPAARAAGDASCFWSSRREEKVSGVIAAAGAEVLTQSRAAWVVKVR
jgi:galactokinase/mevalonate kinase-like predicted kinase